MNSLERFQESGNAESLLEFVRVSGRSVDRYEQAVAGLAPVFEGLTYGERPAYERLDKDLLRQLTPEVEQIVQWMDSSDKANIRTRAIELMGALGYDSFGSPLERHVASKVQWERLSAIAALASMHGKRSTEILNSIADDPDPQIRAEVRRLTTIRKGV